MLHETCAGATVQLLEPAPQLHTLLTNFPKTGSQIFIPVEIARELVAVIELAHQAQELLRRNSSVNLRVPKEVVGRFDEEQL